MNEFHNVNYKDINYRKHLQTLEAAQQQLSLRNYPPTPANPLPMHSTYGYSTPYPLNPQIFDTNPTSSNCNYVTTSVEPSYKQSKLENNKKQYKQRMMLPPPFLQDRYNLAAAYSYMSQTANLYKGYNQHNNLLLMPGNPMNCSKCYTPYCTCLANAIDGGHLARSINSSAATSASSAASAVAAAPMPAIISRNDFPSSVAVDKSPVLWHYNTPPLPPLPPLPPPPPMPPTTVAMDQTITTPPSAVEATTNYLNTCQSLNRTPVVSPSPATLTNALVPTCNENSLKLSTLLNSFTKFTSKKDLCKYNTKKIRRKVTISSRCGTPKDLSLESAIRAIRIEEEYMSRLEDVQCLVLRFPDPEINSSIVRNYSSDIANVYFLNSSASRHCTVHLKPNTNVDKLIAYLSKIPFGTGYISVELKTKTITKTQTKPEDIDPCTLYVGNLSKTITREILRQRFPNCIRIDIGFAVRLKKTRYAFIRYSNVDDAIEAYKNAFNTQADNRSIILRFRRINNTALKEADTDSCDGDLDVDDGLLLDDSSMQGQETLLAIQNSSDTDSLIEINNKDRNHFKRPKSRNSSIAIQTEDHACHCNVFKPITLHKQKVDAETQTNFDKESVETAGNQERLIDAATQTSSIKERIDENTNSTQITIKRECETPPGRDLGIIDATLTAENSLQEVNCWNSTAVAVKIETTDNIDESDTQPSTSRNLLSSMNTTDMDDNDLDDMVPANNLLGKCFIKQEENDVDELNSGFEENPQEENCFVLNRSEENVNDEINISSSINSSTETNPIVLSPDNNLQANSCNTFEENSINRNKESNTVMETTNTPTNVLNEPSANQFPQPIVITSSPLNTTIQSRARKRKAKQMDPKAMERASYLKKLYQDIYNNDDDNDDNDGDGKCDPFKDNSDIYRKLNSDSDSDLDNLL